MAKYQCGAAALVLAAFLLVGILGCPSSQVIPEMKDVIDNFTDRTRRGGGFEQIRSGRA